MSENKFVSEMLTLQWLHEQYYQKSVCSLAESEIKMLKDLEAKYATTDVVRVLLKLHQELEQALESIAAHSPSERDREIALKALGREE